jgi:hypothetical protein
MPTRATYLTAIEKISGFAIWLALSLSGPLLAQNELSAAQAKQHVGEKATVCGA